MKEFTGKLKNIVWLAVFIAGLCLQGLHGQETPNASASSTDSIAQEESIVAQGGIPYNEILIAAGESRIRTTRISESLISTERIEIENQRNDSILTLIDSALTITRGKDYSQESQRYLTNEKNYWQTANNHIRNQKERLSDLIRDLQDQQKLLGSELYRWESTRQMQDSSYAFGNISQVIDTTLMMVNILASEVEARTELLIEPLNKTISTEVEVNLLISKVQEALLEKTSLTYAKTSPSLFELKSETIGAENRNDTKSIMASLRSEWNAIVFHFKQHRKAYTLYFVFALAVLVLFSWMSTRLKQLSEDDLSYYQTTFKTILKRPIAAGILFSLFLTVVFFPERPPLLVDLIILLLVIPIVDLTLKLSHKRAHRFIWIYAGMVVVFLGLRFIPAGSFLYRITRLGLGLVELIVLVQFSRHPDILALPTRTLSRFVRFLISLHLLLVVVGLVSSVLGYERLSQVTLDSALTNALVGILLFICAVILIGGLQFFISSKYLDQFQVTHDHEQYLKGFVARIVILAMTLFWLDATLRIFYMKNDAYKLIRTIFTRELNVGTMSFSLADIFLFVFIIWLSVVLSRVIKIVLRTDVLDKFFLKKGVP